MSRSSFPSPEHARLLREAISVRLLSRTAPLALAEQGLDQYRCCYRFGVRRSPESDWRELSIHFQVAERLKLTHNAEELGRILDLFLERHFADDLPA
jgi:hypothetical protein